jgi:2-polyprenyl-3-methyl-5-hydroxy-6-metoxy-1,4-benzoquinol methylase
MRLAQGHTFRTARRTTLALATAAFIALAQGSLAQRLERPPLDVPYVPTPPEVVDGMLDIAFVRPNDFVIDLGSGDGRIATAAGKRGARALGVDIDPKRVQEAQENARRAGVQDRVSFVQQNLFDTRISDAAVLTMYLLAKVNLDLRPRILQELKPGTRVVSHTFEMGDWKPDAQAEIGHRQIFMWIVPAKVAGRWRFQAESQTFELVLHQEYQYLSGRAHIGSRAVAVRSGWLHGNHIHLELADGREFAGHVDGDRMVPMAEDEKGFPWHATRLS